MKKASLRMRMLTIYKISVVLMVGLTLLYTFQAYYLGFVSSFSNFSLPVVAGAAAVMSIFSLRRYWRTVKERFSMIWLSFTLGLFLWFLGEVGWMVYTLIGVEIPYPSFADIFWLVGYVPFFVALYLYVKTFASALSKRILVVSMSVTFLLTVLVTFSLITPVLGAEEDIATLIVDFAYPFLDLALLCISILGLFIFFKGNLGKSWAFINGALLLNTVADILFSYTTSQNTYYNGHPIDLLYTISYIFFALAFYVHVKEL